MNKILDLLAQRAKAVIAAVAGAAVAYFSTAGTQATLHGLYAAVASAFGAAVLVHQTPNRAKPKKKAKKATP